MNANAFGSYLDDKLVTKIEKEKRRPVCLYDLRAAKRNEIVHWIVIFIHIEIICKEGQLLFTKCEIDIESRQFPSKLTVRYQDIMLINPSNSVLIKGLLLYFLVYLKLYKCQIT